MATAGGGGLTTIAGEGGSRRSGVGGGGGGGVGGGSLGGSGAPGGSSGAGSGGSGGEQHMRGMKTAGTPGAGVQAKAWESPMLVSMLIPEPQGRVPSMVVLYNRYLAWGKGGSGFRMKDSRQARRKWITRTPPLTINKQNRVPAWMPRLCKRGSQHPFVLCWHTTRGPLVQDLGVAPGSDAAPKP